MLNPEFESLSWQFLKEIEAKPTAEHPKGQLEHAERKITVAQDYLRRGQTLNFSYQINKFPLPEFRLVQVTQPVVDGIKKVAQALRRHG